jgi:hypothetical protein
MVSQSTHRLLRQTETIRCFSFFFFVLLVPYQVYRLDIIRSLSKRSYSGCHFCPCRGAATDLAQPVKPAAAWPSGARGACGSRYCPSCRTRQRAGARLSLQRARAHARAGWAKTRVGDSCALRFARAWGDGRVLRGLMQQGHALHSAAVRRRSRTTSDARVTIIYRVARCGAQAHEAVDVARQGLAVFLLAS